MNEKGRQTKLLAAIAVLAMVVCVFAVVMPSVDAAASDYNVTDSGITPITGEKEIGSAEDLLELADQDDTYGNRIVVGAAGATLVLTADIETVDVGFILNGNLTIKSNGNTAYSLGIDSDAITATKGATNYNAIVYANADVSFNVDNAKVSITNTANNTYVNTIFNNQYEETTLTVNVTNGSELSLAQSGTATQSGSSWLTNVGANGILNVSASKVIFGDIGAVQASIVNVSNGSTIDATAMTKATLTCYLKLSESTFNAGKLGLYAANITDGKIDAETLGVYASGTGTANGFTLGTIAMTGESTVDATTIINGLSSSTATGTKTINFTGSGAVIGELTGVSADKIGNYKFTGINVDGVTLGENAKVDPESTYPAGSDGVTVDITADQIGTAFDNGATIANVTSGTISSNITVPAGNKVVISDKVSIDSGASIILAGESGNSGSVEINATTSKSATIQMGTEETAATVEVSDFTGSLNITWGSVEITQSEIDSGDITITDETEIILENVTVNGTTNLNVPKNSTVTIKDGVTINEGGTLNINGTDADADNHVDVRLSKSNTLTVDGKLSLGAYVDMDAKGAVNGDGEINVNANASLSFSSAMIEVTGDGEVVNNAVTGGTINLNDGTVVDAKSSVDASATQEVVVSGEVTVVAGGKIIINGQLTIEEGAELILEEGAQLIINSTGNVDLKGTITVEATGTNDKVIFDYGGASMEISGTLDLEGSMSAQMNGPMTVTGTVNIGDGASATFNEKSTIAAGGNLNVEGVASGSIVNAGTITIDSENAFGTFTVYMMDASTLNLDNAVGTVNVDDSKMMYKVSGVETKIKNPMTASFVNVSGVTVTDSLIIKNEDLNDDGVNERNGYGNMAVSGNADLATNINDDLAGTADITVLTGTLNVAEGATLDMSVDTRMIVSAGAELYVVGTVTNVDKDTVKDSIGNSGEITVTGLIQSSVEISNSGDGVVNAAMYEDEDADVYNYTTLAKAIDAGATDIEVTGTIYIDSDVTIPVGTTVTSTGATVNIEEDATLTVAATDNSSGKFKNGTVNVDGTMVVQNLKKSSVDEEQVISDVSTTDGVSATYTNIYNALAGAKDGETVTITKGGDGIVELDKNLTIPTGVTLEIPADKTVKALAGVTVTVDGTLSFEDGTYEMAGENTTAKKDAAKTVVNGLLETDDTTEYRTANNGDSQIVGAYFDMDGLQCIAPVAYAASVIDDVESDVEIVGKVTAQDVEFNCTADEGFKIVVTSGSSLTAGTIMLSGIDLEFVGTVNATVEVAGGSFTLKDVTGGSVADVAKFDQDNNESHVASLSGGIDNASADGKTLDGMVTANGTVEVSIKSIAADFVVAEGATATVVSDSASFSDKTVVNGSLVIDASGVALTGTTVVYGTISVEEDASATAKTMYIGYDVDKDTGYVTGIATGTVTGVSLDSTSGVATVTPGSTFTATQAQAEGMLSTEYYIYDDLWMTAYAVANNVDIPDLKAQIENAECLGWKNADGQSILTTTTPSTHAVIGSTGFEQIYADINPDIYMVYVVADEGIGTVYIDGMVMTKVSNVFILMRGGESVALAAGEHTISYVLTSGFSGTVKMYVNGTEDSDMTFTLEGNLKADEETSAGDFVNYTINLVGVEPSTPVTPSTGGSSDDGMGLTDYLLIILVILIVVMAIIVALRLMRS